MVKAATVTLRLLKRVGLPDSLEEIGAPLGASEWEGWEREVWLALKAYLRKLPAMSEVLSRCLSLCKVSVPSYDDLPANKPLLGAVPRPQLSPEHNRPLLLPHHSLLR